MWYSPAFHLMSGGGGWESSIASSGLATAAEAARSLSARLLQSGETLFACLGGQVVSCRPLAFEHWPLEGVRSRHCFPQLSQQLAEKVSQQLRRQLRG